MNKSDYILMLERVREGIRKLPEGADIYSVGYAYEPMHGKPIANIHLSSPVEWAAVFDGKDFTDWVEKRICLLPDVYGWWADYKRGDDDE